MKAICSYECGDETTTQCFVGSLRIKPCWAHADLKINIGLHTHPKNAGLFCGGSEILFIYLLAMSKLLILIIFTCYFWACTGNMLRFVLLLYFCIWTHLEMIKCGRVLRNLLNRQSHLNWQPRLNRMDRPVCRMHVYSMFIKMGFFDLCTFYSFS